MLAYTYYTIETTRPTAKLNLRNFKQVFENDFVLIKIKQICIFKRSNGSYYSGARHGIDENRSISLCDSLLELANTIKTENSRLFKLLTTLQLPSEINLLESVKNIYSYLLFEKQPQCDGSFSYKYTLTTGSNEQLTELTESIVDITFTPEIPRAPRPYNITNVRNIHGRRMTASWKKRVNEAFENEEEYHPTGDDGSPNDEEGEDDEYE